MTHGDLSDNKKKLLRKFELKIVRTLRNQAWAISSAFLESNMFQKICKEMFNNSEKRT